MQNIELPEDDFSFKNYFVPLTNAKAITWIVIIGFIVYANMLFNGFVADDLTQIIASVQVITNILGIFVNNTIVHITGGYYRPIPFILYAIIYSFFQTNTFFYHLFQLFFHIANSILIFLIFKNFFRRGMSFFLALLFLVHPINVETVVYISDLQDVLFLFFGLFAIYFLQKKSEKIKYIILANVLLLLSFFSKETGVLFLIPSLLYVFFFKKNKLLIHTFFSFSICLLYLFMRLIAHVPFQKTSSFPIPIMQETLFERMLNIPAIIFYYIKNFVFPDKLIALQTWVIPNITLNNFFLPLFFDCIFFISLFLITLYVYKKTNKKKTLLFFLIWFLTGFVVWLQIIPLDTTVADRYFYFPFVGLLAILGFFSQSIKINTSNGSLFIILGIFIVILFSLRTIVRNTNWQNQYVLLSHDEKISTNDYFLELQYGNELLRRNDYNDAFVHIQNAITIYPKSSDAWNSLGVIYLKEGKFSLASKSFLRSITIDNYKGAYENMVLLLITQKKLLEAKNFVREANAKFPADASLWFYRIILEYKTRNHNEALYAAQKYFQLTPDSESYSIYRNLQENQPINTTLK